MPTNMSTLFIRGGHHPLYALRCGFSLYARLLARDGVDQGRREIND
jgi:hypothetical protein